MIELIKSIFLLYFYQNKFTLIACRFTSIDENKIIIIIIIIIICMMDQYQQIASLYCLALKINLKICCLQYIQCNLTSFVRNQQYFILEISFLFSTI